MIFWAPVATGPDGTPVMVIGGVPRAVTPLELRIRRLRAIEQGLRTLGLSTAFCRHTLAPGEPCWRPKESSLERQAADPRHAVVPCEWCGLLPLTTREEERLVRAGEESVRQAVASQVRTSHDEYAGGMGSWRCQHGRQWYFGPPNPFGRGGRPVGQPTTLGSGTDFHVFDCGHGEACSEIHRARREAGDVRVRL